MRDDVFWMYVHDSRHLFNFANNKFSGRGYVEKLKSRKEGKENEEELVTAYKTIDSNK